MLSTATYAAAWLPWSSIVVKTFGDKKNFREAAINYVKGLAV